MERIKRFLKDEEGVTMLEYGLIAALVGVAAIVALTTLGTKLSSTFSNVATQVGS
jgi:pilus assembly protein Flp/PilA